MFVSEQPIEDTAALVEVLAWYQTVARLLPKPVTTFHWGTYMSPGLNELTDAV